MLEKSKQPEEQRKANNELFNGTHCGMPSQSSACGTSENAFALSPRVEATIAPNPSIEPGR